mgnify:CR=1 FL=1
MSNHTPGPWLMAAKPSSVVGWPIVATPSGRSIASLNYVQTSLIDPKVDGDDAFNRESRANGLLIAAAPDLLKAAETALELIECIEDEEGFSPSLARPAVALRAAIGKATGV